VCCNVRCMDQRSVSFILDACKGELVAGTEDAAINRVCTDSRQVQQGDLFVAIKGERFDGHQFLQEVTRKGAKALMVERDKAPSVATGCPVVVVPNTRVALGQLGTRYRQDFDLPFVAVGGSNGKTTTKELGASVLSQGLAALCSEASFNNDLGVPL